MLKLLLTLTCACALMLNVSAQVKVTGKVTDDESGEALAGVSIVVVGTTTGTISNADGNYEIEVAPDARLKFSFIGFKSFEIDVNNQSTINVNLEPDFTFLESVVVTAFGLEREKKALGYSVTEVRGDELVEARENSFINSLSGKIAGVVVNQSPTGPAGSTRVVIRGNASLTGNNQPLYVVDGIPLDNSNLGAAGMWGGKDLGDGISSLNPDDIESMSVLKGPAASALYGARGQNGVVLITTKKGVSREGIGVEFNSNLVFEDPLIDTYDDFQYEYGSGSQGVAPATQDEAIQWNRLGWGAPIRGQDVIQYDGVVRPYVAQRDNIKDFYETGRTFTNTVALTGGSDKANFRFSASYLDNEGIVPESGLERYTFNLRGGANLSDKLSADVKINYIEETADNRPSLSDTPENPGLVIPELSPTTSIKWLRNYKDENGDQIPWNSSQFRTNPYWGVFEQTNLDKKERVLGFVSLKYEFTDWLSLQVRTGTDQYTLRQTDIDNFGTSYVPLGRVAESFYDVKERNSDLLLQFNKSLNDDFEISATFGANHRTQRTEFLQQRGDDFFTRGFTDISNTVRKSTDARILSQREVNSVFGSVQFAYKNFLFLDVTGRNDWSSTLTNPLDPEGSDNSFFYPSASLSFAFTDAFQIGWGPLTFGKIRASAARVGNDSEDPFVQLLTYQINNPSTHLGQGLGQIGTDRIPNSGLVPEENNAIELGFDLRFFQNKLGVDFTWYRQEAKNLIIPVNVSQTTGFNSSIVNAGVMRNTGIELLITGTPVNTASGFSWDVGVNFGKNNNEVVSLRDPVERLTIGTSRSFVTVEARLDEPYGSIVGSPYRRTPDGEIIYDTDGTPLTGRIQYDANGNPVLDDNGNAIIDSRVALGTANPDWTAGITNTFTYKGISFSALIDIRQGGELYSITNSLSYGNGSHINTLEGRQAFIDNGTGIVGEGVVNNGTTENPEFANNTIAVNPQTYYGSLPDEEFIYDASFIKMRQMTLGYRLPSSFISKTPFQSVKVSIVGRNLFYISRNVDNIDPESTYSSRNDSQGFEYGTIPTTRSWGFNLNVRF